MTRDYPLTEPKVFSSGRLSLPPSLRGFVLDEEMMMIAEIGSMALPKQLSRFGMLRASKVKLFGKYHRAWRMKDVREIYAIARLAKKSGFSQIALAQIVASLWKHPACPSHLFPDGKDGDLFIVIGDKTTAYAASENYAELLGEGVLWGAKVSFEADESGSRPQLTRKELEARHPSLLWLNFSKALRASVRNVKIGRDHLN